MLSYRLCTRVAHSSLKEQRRFLTSMVSQGLSTGLGISSSLFVLMVWVSSRMVCARSTAALLIISETGSLNLDFLPRASSPRGVHLRRLMEKLLGLLTLLAASSLVPSSNNAGNSAMA